MIRRIGLGLVTLVVVAVVGLGLWLAVAPPELLRVADGYAAKIVCSNVFLAHRDPSEVLAVDVQAPGHPVLKLINVSVDKAAGTVTAKMLGFVAPQVAISRPGFGCTLVPDGKLSAVAEVPAPGLHVAGIAPWDEAPDTKVAAMIADATLAGPGVRAIVVAKAGKLAGETYAPGFSKDTPMLGWSMAKTVNAMLIGRLMLQGKIVERGSVDGVLRNPRHQYTKDLLAAVPRLD